MTRNPNEGLRPKGLLYEVMKKLTSVEGLTVSEFEEKRHLLVAPGETLEAFVSILVDNLAIVQKDERLVWNRELEVARMAYDLARVEACRLAEITRRGLKLPEIHDPHL